MRLVLALAALFAVGTFLRASYLRWREATRRERFLLAMKEASTPEVMNPEEISRLRLLRSPWWAAWKWLPDLRRRPPPFDPPSP